MLRWGFGPSGKINSSTGKGLITEQVAGLLEATPEKEGKKDQQREFQGEREVWTPGKWYSMHLAVLHQGLLLLLS